MAKTLAGSTPGLMVPMARIFVVGVGASAVDCAWPVLRPIKGEPEGEAGGESGFHLLYLSCWRRRVGGTDRLDPADGDIVDEPQTEAVGSVGSQRYVSAPCFGRSVNVRAAPCGWRRYPYRLPRRAARNGHAIVCRSIGRRRRLTLVQT